MNVLKLPVLQIDTVVYIQYYPNMFHYCKLNNIGTVFLRNFEYIYIRETSVKLRHRR